MNTIKYKKFITRVEFDTDMNLFCGTVINSAPHTFYADNVEQLHDEFKTTIDEYLKICAEKGQQPRKSYSGKFVARLSPEVHTEIAHAAIEQSKSLNKWVSEVLVKAAH